MNNCKKIIALTISVLLILSDKTVIEAGEIRSIDLQPNIKQRADYQEEHEVVLQEEEIGTIEKSIHTEAMDHAYPDRDVTDYDNYMDIDLLFEDIWGSLYNEPEDSILYDMFYMAGSTKRDTLIKVHKAQTDSENSKKEYFVYDRDGKLADANVRVIGNLLIIKIKNKRGIMRYTVVDSDEHVIVENVSGGEYFYDQTRVNTANTNLEAFGKYDYSTEVLRPLTVKDNITEADLSFLLQTYPNIPEDSLLKKDGVASAFIRVQEEYDVSALGLLSIACLESAYGTSRIARNKQNLFGWGAVDSNPYNGAWDWSNMPTSEAIYKALSLVASNYPRGKYEQNSFYSMRWNNNVHQYCTSTTWPNSNALIRAQLETYIGLR